MLPNSLRNSWSKFIRLVFTPLPPPSFLFPMGKNFTWILFSINSFKWSTPVEVEGERRPIIEMVWASLELGTLAHLHVRIVTLILSFCRLHCCSFSAFPSFPYLHANTQPGTGSLFLHRLMWYSEGHCWCYFLLASLSLGCLPINEDQKNRWM